MKERIAKLYFSSTAYPPPKNKNKCADDTSLGCLKDYIEFQAKLGGSAIVCIVGNSSKKEKQLKHACWNCLMGMKKEAGQGGG